MKKILCAAGMVAVLLVAGCGGSGSSSPTTSVSGAVADGYLQNALVFMDKNGNYQFDAGEPSTTTDTNGAYTLPVSTDDIGRYPIVAMAIQGQTVDKDAGPVTGTYILCTPGAGVSGTVSNFISPFSTLLRAKLEANPGMTVAEAAVQLRSQLNMPAGLDVMADFMAGGAAGQNAARYQAMHQVAQQMASLMAGQADLVMNGRNPDPQRFRSMMAQMNQNLPQIADNAVSGGGMDSTSMNSLRTQMRATLGAMPMNSGFRNYSTMFTNMTGARYFWNYSGGRIRPSGSMMGGM